jgi:hypothetical protein
MYYMMDLFLLIALSSHNIFRPEIRFDIYYLLHLNYQLSSDGSLSATSAL